MKLILRAKLPMPTNLSLEAQLLLRALFKRNPANRLGGSNMGIDDVKKQEFFSSVDWDALLAKQTRPPFKPAVATADDAIYFDSEFTSKTPCDSPGVPASATAHELFRGFSFVAPCVLDGTENLLPANPGIIANGKVPQVPGGVQTQHMEVTGSLKLATNATSFQDEYELLGELGRGSFSIVKLCQHKATGQQYAVKV